MSINNEDNKLSLFKVLNLSKKLAEKYKKEIINVMLDPGEKLNQFGSSAPGVLFIEEGEVRLLSVDKHKELLTVEKFSSNQLVGAHQILRESLDQSIAASSKVKGSLLPKNTFLELIKIEPKILELFSPLSINELFLTIYPHNNKILLNANELLLWTKEEVKKERKVKSLKVGEKLLSDDCQEWLVSSCNVQGFKPGEIIKSTEQVLANR